MNNKISLENLLLYQKKGAVLVDLRSPLEYQQNHLNGAINIPYQNVLEHFKHYPKDTIIIIYCSTGRKSKMVCSLLLNMGFNNTYDLGKVTF